MTSFKMPSLFETTTANKFFQDFVELNRHRRSFSQRSISQKLGWPISYIPDLIKGRKVLSIQRAIQFGRYFKLDPISLEKLILLSIESMKLLSSREMEELKSTKSRVRKDKTKDTEILDAKMMLVFECIRWLKGTGTKKDIVELLSARHITANDVIRALETLSKKALITKLGDKYKASTENLFSDDSGDIDDSALHIQFAEILQAFFKKKVGPALYNSAYVHIERSRFNEIADRIVALRNWIFEISIIDGKRSIEEDVRLFQLDFNVTPIFSKEQAARWRQRT